MKRILILAFLLCATIFSAQTSAKQHFIIHSVDHTTDLKKYETAANTWGKLDEFRLLDKRRIISFTDHKATIELFSANELKDLYGKQISPLTITSNQYREIEFEVTPDGKGLKPQIAKN